MNASRFENQSQVFSVSDVYSKIDRLVTKTLVKEEPGDAVLVLKDGMSVYAKDHGYADIANKRPINAVVNYFKYLLFHL